MLARSLVEAPPVKTILGSREHGSGPLAGNQPKLA